MKTLRQNYCVAILCLFTWTTIDASEEVKPQFSFDPSEALVPLFPFHRVEKRRALSDQIVDEEATADYEFDDTGET